MSGTDYHYQGICLLHEQLQLDEEYVLWSTQDLYSWVINTGPPAGDLPSYTQTFTRTSSPQPHYIYPSILPATDLLTSDDKCNQGILILITDN